MKGKAKILAAFALGLLVGVVGMFLFMGINTRKVMAIYADAQLLEMAANASLLRSGQAETLLGRYEDSIPRTVLYFENYHRRFLRGTQAHAALWQVQRFYELSPSLEAPADIKPVLDALPPRPVSSCEIGQRASEERKADQNDNAAEPNAPADAEKPDRTPRDGLHYELTITR